MTLFKTPRYIIIIAVISIAILLTIPFQLGSAFEREITIAKKYTAIGGVRYAYTQYMIVTTDGSIYQVSNVWWRADFNNEEDWNTLDIGKTYRVKGWGYRVPLFGLYPNIYEIVNNAK
jgi:cytochrome b subunit of formate dehydrogenase